MDREYILRLLRAQINVNGHIIGAAVGSGMTAKFAAMGGADLLLHSVRESTVLWDGALCQLFLLWK